MKCDRCGGEMVEVTSGMACSKCMAPIVPKKARDVRKEKREQRQREEEAERKRLDAIVAAELPEPVPFTTGRSYKAPRIYAIPGHPGVYRYHAPGPGRADVEVRMDNGRNWRMHTIVSMKRDREMETKLVAFLRVANLDLEEPEPEGSDR